MRKTRIYKTVVLPLALCSHETLSLTLEEECKLQVSENKVIREIFGYEKDKGLNELCDVCWPCGTLRRVKCRRQALKETRNTCRIWAGRQSGM
jgi:hypothetical protein